MDYEKFKVPDDILAWNANNEKSTFIKYTDKLGQTPIQVTDNQPFEKGIAYAKP